MSSLKRQGKCRKGVDRDSGAGERNSSVSANSVYTAVYEVRRSLSTKVSSKGGIAQGEPGGEGGESRRRAKNKLWLPSYGIRKKPRAILPLNLS